MLFFFNPRPRVPDVLIGSLSAGTTGRVRILFVCCFQRFLILFYTVTLFSGNNLTEKSPRIFELYRLDNIAPRARAQEHPSSEVTLGYSQDLMFAHVVSLLQKAPVK